MRIDLLRTGVLALTLTAGAGIAEAATVELVSKADPVPSSAGLGSGNNALSADGRWIAFSSDSPNLAPGQVDRNGFDDIFLHDRIAGTTTLITHAAGSPNMASSQRGFFRDFDVHISADGRFVAFSGTMSDVVPGATDANEDSDVFLYDRVTDTLTLVSHAAGNLNVSADGSSFGARMSTDGNWIAFTSEATNLVAGVSAFARNVYLWHRPSGSITLVSHESGVSSAGANGDSKAAGISADGSFVVFTSKATDLLPGQADDNGSDDVFVYQHSSGTVSLVSRAAGSTATAAFGTSSDPHISADGRWIAFASNASELIPGQIDNVSSLDAFLFDRISGEMRLASRRSASPVAAGEIVNLFGGLEMSADGRFVAFTSEATDLVPGQVDINEAADLFLYDRVSGATTLVSHVSGLRTTATVDPVPSRMPSLSADGRFIAFTSQAQDLVPGQTGVRYISGVFLYDRSLDTTVLVSHHHASATTTPNNATGFSEISADGNVVAFKGPATDVVEGLVNPDQIQNLFLYSRASGEVTHLSRSDPGSPVATPNGPSTAAALSRDGNTVLFFSRANGLVPGQIDESSGPGNRFGTWDAFLRDRTTGKTVLLSRAGTGTSKVTAAGAQEAVLSADGRFAAVVTYEDVQSPPSSVWRLFLYDRTTDSLTLVNRSQSSAARPEGVPYHPALSADGRYLAFACQQCGVFPGRETGDTDVLLYDRVTKTYALVATPSVVDGFNLELKISADGRFVAFMSRATDLIPRQADAPETSDLFLFDRMAGKLSLVSHAPDSAVTARGGVFGFVLSADGRWIAFKSTSSSLVPGQIDTNRQNDLFLHDQVSGRNILVSHAVSSPVTAGDRASASSFDGLSISADGRFIAFASLASDLVAGVVDTNETPDVFLYDRVTGTTSLLSAAPGSPVTAASRGAGRPAISADGSRVAFLSGSPELLPPGVGVPPEGPAALPPVSLFVVDRSSGTRIVAGPVHPSVPISIAPLSFKPELSGNGRFVAFTSDSDQLVPGDFNANWDAFVFDAGLSGGATPLPPCKLLDTRRRADRPVLTSNVQRAVTVRGACGVPATAKQVVAKVMVFNPSGKGNLRFYPGAVTATPSGILRFERGVTRTEIFTLPLGSNGTLTILPFVAGKGTVHVAMEVTGYAN